MIEPEFGESRPYLPPFVNSMLVSPVAPDKHPGHYSPPPEGHVHDLPGDASVPVAGGDDALPDDWLDLSGLHESQDLVQAPQDPPEPNPVRSQEIAEEPGFESVPPLPFDSGDSLSGEPLVPLTPEFHAEWQPEGPDEPFEVVGPLQDLKPSELGDLELLPELEDVPEVGESSEFDDLSSWPEMEGVADEETTPPTDTPSLRQETPVEAHSSSTELPAHVESVPAAEFGPAAESGPSVSTAGVSAPRLPQPAFDPFFGMGRDQASFIGGFRYRCLSAQQAEAALQPGRRYL